MKLTREQENQVKIAANLHGLDIPWTSAGDIDPTFAVGVLVGMGLGHVLDKKGPEEFNKALDVVTKAVPGVEINVKTGE